VEKVLQRQIGKPSGLAMTEEVDQFLSSAALEEAKVLKTGQKPLADAATIQERLRGSDPDNLSLRGGGILSRMGSIAVLRVGYLDSYAGGRYVYPIGFMSIRRFWEVHPSSRQAAPRRASYLCSITQRDGKPYFAITRLPDHPHGGNTNGSAMPVVVCEGSEIEGVFQVLLDRIGLTHETPTDEEAVSRAKGKRRGRPPLRPAIKEADAGNRDASMEIGEPAPEAAQASEAAEATADRSRDSAAGEAAPVDRTQHAPMDVVEGPKAASQPPDSSRDDVHIKTEEGAEAPVGGASVPPEEPPSVAERVACRMRAETFFGLDAPLVVEALKRKVKETMRRRVLETIPAHLLDVSHFTHHQQLRWRRLPRPQVPVELGVVTEDVTAPEEASLVRTIALTKPATATQQKMGLRRQRKVETQNNVPLAMQYRILQRMPPEKRLMVRTSNIHGLGLFATEQINGGDMVVEYMGDVIRNAVADKREKIYELELGSEGACYMFKLDDELVVDATRCGNVARFINHCCEPNCICKIMVCDAGQKHIMIIAKRDIVPFEEITYDYKFNVESEKIMCRCGAPNCLGRMN